MKKLAAFVFALLLGASLAFAQGNSQGQDKNAPTTAADSGKKTTKTKKGHKGGKKGKKSSGGSTTGGQPPK